MIIAIDGPAASGKSTTAQCVAQALGFRHIDTGAMYRAITYYFLKHDIAYASQEAVRKAFDDLEMRVEYKDTIQETYINDQLLNEELRTVAVTEKVSAVSALAYVRHKMVDLQRKIAQNYDVVLEGRDIGTIVFPEADLKIYMIADTETRAKRRMLDLEKQGEIVSLDILIKDIEARDKYDSERSFSPLKPAKDAIQLDTTKLSIQEQVDDILKRIQTNINGGNWMIEEQKAETPVAENDVTEVSEETSNAVEMMPVEEAPVEEARTKITDKRAAMDEMWTALRTVKREDIGDDLEGDAQNHSDLQTLYDQAMKSFEQKSLVQGKVVSINDRDVIVDIGFKSEGIVSKEEFNTENMPEVGAEIELFLDRMDDRKGTIMLSKKKADFLRIWKTVKDKFEAEELITGTISRRIKGGMVVSLNGIDAFLPGSQLDVRPISDFDSYVGKTMEFKIVKVNEFRKNIVLSRKEILQEALHEKRRELLLTIEPGSILEGRVKNITDFGVFVDLDGIDGLLHITDLSWGRVNHPREVVEMGETLTVKVIEFDKEKQRVSLGLKQLQPHPWENVEEKFPIGSSVKGKIVSITSYGAFVEIEEGVEGLIHISEISWTQHIKHPTEVFTAGEEIDAIILAIDTNERKISLGVKQLQPDPWTIIESKFVVGSTHTGIVRNLTQFGAFVELEEGIDGLVHISDLSWTRKIRHPKELLRKGQEIDVKILDISQENRKISLGFKQVEADPWDNIKEQYFINSEHKATVFKILEKGIILTFPETDVEGIILLNHFRKKERTEVIAEFTIDQVLDVKVVLVDSNEKKIVVSHESAIKDKERENIEEYIRGQESDDADKLIMPEELLKRFSKEEDEAAQ